MDYGHVNNDDAPSFVIKTGDKVSVDAGMETVKKIGIETKNDGSIKIESDDPLRATVGIERRSAGA